MSSAAALRSQIEQSLERSFPAALTPMPRVGGEVAATGIACVDALLDGGLPVGAISELTGPACSGRTSLAVAFMAQRTREGSVVAWVDCSDSFDPESAAATGLLLKQLLWVRCQAVTQPQQAAPGAQTAGWKGRPRRGTRIDQALQATDLLLQAGGFASIVLDMGEVDTELGYRIPLATWFRFRQATDRARTSLIVLGKESYAQSSAAVVLEGDSFDPQTSGTTVLNGMSYTVRRGRQRFAQAGLAGMRKSPSAEWRAGSAWEVRKSA